MSLNNEPTAPGENRPRSSPLKFLMNVAIFGFFLIGIVVSAGSFGLFGCVCNNTWTDRPSEKVPDPPSKGGEMPPLPNPK